MYTPPYGPSPPMYYEYKINTMSSSPGSRFEPKYPYFSGSSRESSKERVQKKGFEPNTYTYASPRAPAYFTPPPYSYANPDNYTLKYVSPKRNDFASPTDRMRSKAHRYTESDPVRYPSRKMSRSSQMQDVFVEDDGYNYSPKGSPPPPYNDPVYEDQYYDSAHQQDHGDGRRSRGRAVSHSVPVSKSGSSKSMRRTAILREPPKATADDAARAGIPAGYSYKNWDPTEEPIFLLGSVFDANSLGKWIYDWTVYHHGASTPLADLAGDLWLLLIQVAGKIKRAEECLPRIRHRDDRYVVDEFVGGGKRLWNRLTRILKVCEDFMWRVAKKAKSGKKQQQPQISMGANSGCEFVNSIFGRDRELEETEQLMAHMRLWNVRFDTYCEDILRRPSG